jgi:hypothetical protein
LGEDAAAGLLELVQVLLRSLKNGGRVNVGCKSLDRRRIWRYGCPSQETRTRGKHAVLRSTTKHSAGPEIPTTELPSFPAVSGSRQSREYLT